MILIAGTLPMKDLPPVSGPVREEGGDLLIEGHAFPCAQGTGALVSAALVTTRHLGIDPPQALVAGDVGRGRGSMAIYDHLAQRLPDISPDVLVMHYILPDMGQIRRVCEAANLCGPKPLMVADAASMYAAKAAGVAASFDIFTPDTAEMGFLADPEATHPAYISDHLFNTDNGQIPDLISAARRQGNSPGLLLVKGATDYIASDGTVIGTVTTPDVPAMEAIGGTGDTITGILAALLDTKMDPIEAALIAARVNRKAGQLAKASPATRISQIIEQFPTAFEEYLPARSGAGSTNYIE